MIGGKRRADRSRGVRRPLQLEEAVRAVERLVTQDKVDLLFQPWGTGLNLAVGPVFNKYGYPQLTFSAVTDRAPELAKRWPNSFWLLGTSQAICRCAGRSPRRRCGTRARSAPTLR